MGSKVEQWAFIILLVYNILIFTGFAVDFVSKLM